MTFFMVYGTFYCLTFLYQDKKLTKKIKDLKKIAENNLSHLNLPNFPTVISSSPPSFRSAAEKSYCFENMEIFHSASLRSK
jgi:hypothetical protein